MREEDAVAAVLGLGVGERTERGVVAEEAEDQCVPLRAAGVDAGTAVQRPGVQRQYIAGLAPRLLYRVKRWRGDLQASGCFLMRVFEELEDL
ncbi:hypothetical protein, partial [Streptomyces sp. NPDC059262]|uniref:hypothetical protein n=1 Tax=Streptomyces sp. NPDC059262 TaxID=3346797 RepID=UPI0036A23A9F